MSTAGQKAATGESAARSAPSFRWDDPLLFDDQLTEDERLIRDTARGYAQDKLMPRVIDAYMQEHTDRAVFNEMGELGLLGVDDPRGLWRRRSRLRLLWAGGARDRAGRFRLPLDDERAVVARDVSDLRLWRRNPAQEVSAQARDRRVGRLLRPHRARRRLRSRRHEDAGREGRRRLPPDRHQDVDFQRAARRRVRDLGEVGGAWRRHPRLRAGEGHEGPLGAEDRRQAVAARLGHRRGGDGRRRRAGRRACCPTCPASRGRSAASPGRGSASRSA